MIYIKVCFLCFYLFQTTSLDAFQKDKTKLKHTIEVYHPGKENGGLQKQALIEVKNNEGKTTAYYADVESVICKETVCKIISVRLFWNEFGAYKKFIIKKGTQLEKWEGLPFTFLDYQKLQDILSNKNSPFKELKIYEVVNTLATSSDGSSSYDGISGATSISLNEYETIFGATLTCYTLWHWVYGSIRTNIRDITGNNLKSSDFIKLLKSKNKEDRNFALEQLTFHLIYEDQISKTILHQYKNDKLSLKSMLNYFEKSTVNI
ncbi:MAG: hypothetical protein ABF286_04355, partial [Polaribacter sp.]